jgi:hypothetical protein
VILVDGEAHFDETHGWRHVSAPNEPPTAARTFLVTNGPILRLGMMDTAHEMHYLGANIVNNEPEWGGWQADQQDWAITSGPSLYRAISGALRAAIFSINGGHHLLYEKQIN